MRTPVIGIIGNRHIINDQYVVHGAARYDCDAIRDICSATPIVIPADPELVSAAELMEICDGILFTGGRANVHPEFYGHAETKAHGTFDRARDGIVLALIKELVARGQPMLAVCRGFQEMNVAFGGTLHPEIRELPGRDNHRMPPDGTQEEKFALRHDVTFTEGGPFHRIFGSTVVRTNTLHGQGIMRTGTGIVIDGYAHDGTPEAIYLEGSPGFALGVQWHPEYRAKENETSRALYGAFGEAARQWANGIRPEFLKRA